MKNELNKRLWGDPQKWMRRFLPLILSSPLPRKTTYLSRHQPYLAPPRQRRQKCRVKLLLINSTLNYQPREFVNLEMQAQEMQG